LKEILGGQLSNLDEKVWRDIIQEVDTNGDGVISLEEFTAMMMRYVDQ
jgi:Ca2+-binding EF-hand superfamily protein